MVDDHLGPRGPPPLLRAASPPSSALDRPASSRPAARRAPDPERNSAAAPTYLKTVISGYPPPDAAIADFEHPVAADGLDQAAVVGGDHQRPAVGVQRRLDHLERVEVEVVGRLVEQDQLRARADDRRHVHARALARAQAPERPADRLRAEPVVGEQRPRLVLGQRGLLAEPRRAAACSRGQARPASAAAGARRRARRPRRVASTSPASTCSSVLLPAPFGPDQRDPVAAVQRQLDVREDALDGDVAQRARSAAGRVLARRARP